MKSNSLYIGKTNVSHEYHHGHTLNGRLCEDRWRKDKDYSKLPYFPEKVGEYPIGDLHDWDTRPHLLKDPLIKAKKDIDSNVRSPEVYVVDKSVENSDEYFESAVLKSIEEAGKKGAYKVLKYYKARPHQAAVCVTLQELWTGKTIIVPLNLCPRFGKDLFHYAIFNALESSGFDVLVFCGYWLGANESFRDTRDEHWDICHNIKIIKPNYDEYLEAKSNGHRIVIDQSLHVDSDTIDPRLLEELKLKPTLVVVDEADFGAWTPLSKSVLDQYVDCGDNNLVLLSTGTNIARAMIGSNTIQDPIVVSYLDLLEKQKDGHETLKDLVKMALLKLQIPQKVLNEWSSFPGNAIPTMKKIWSCRNSHIISPMLETLFYDKEFGTDLFNLYAERYNRIDHPVFQMFVSVGKKDVNNIVSIGRKLAPHLEWIALHGDDHTNRSCGKNIQNLIDNSDKQGTVIVSCSMGARSFSIPNIVGVVNCVDGGGLGTSTQRMSRCLTPGCDKEYGLIVDFCFDSERTSTFESDLISSALDNNPSDLNSAVRRVYGLVQFLKKDENGYLTKLTESECSRYITSDINLKEMACADIDKMGILERLDELKHINGIKSNNKVTSIFDKATNYITSSSKDKGKNIEKKDLKVIKVAMEVVKTAGNVYYLAPNAKSFLEGLAFIAADANKNEEYKKLVCNGAEVIIKDLYQHLPEKMLNIIFTRVSNSVDYKDKHFHNHSSSHITGLFDFSKIKGNKVLYGVKEPDSAAMEELKYLSEIKDVTVLVCQSGYLEFYKLMGYNTITEKEFFAMSKKDFYIISNYPFSDRSGNTSKSKDLDSKFVLKGQEVGVGGQEIMRTKHFTNLSSIFRRKRFSNSNIKSITRLDDNTFPTIQNTETCIIEWDADYNGTTKITYKDGIVVEKQLDKNTVIKLDNPDYIAEVDNNLAHRWVRGKLNRNKMIEGDSPIVEVIGTGETPVVTNIEGGLEETARNTYGVVINVAADWGSLGRVLIKPYEASISSSVMCLITDTKEESIQLQKYLLSDDIKEMVKLNMPSFHPTKDLFLKITDPLV